MRRPSVATAVALALTCVVIPALAQGVAPGAGIGGSTAIGSGLGSVIGTGPSWPNGTNQAPQPSITTVPPGGYGSPAPSATYAPSPSVVAPSSSGGGSIYRQPSEPYPTSSVRPPATIPLVLPDKAGGDLGFLKGCWRTDIFSDAPRKATLTWCFDDKAGGRYLYSRTDQGSFYCNGQAQAQWVGQKLKLSSANPVCDDKKTKVPSELTCEAGTDGALCTGAGSTPTVRLYRVR
jgi:hypothetical protein